MIYKIGTTKEVPMLMSKLPQQVLGELLRGVAVLDAEYGPDRDYLQVGGYSVVAETMDDLTDLKGIINYDDHPCEWATKIGKDSGYASALYLFNDDFSIMAYLPIAIVPDAILNVLED